MAIFYKYFFMLTPLECTVFVTPNITETDSVTNITFDDGEWHRLVAKRQLDTAYIQLDGLYTGNKTKVLGP